MSEKPELRWSLDDVWSICDGSRPVASAYDREGGQELVDALNAGEAARERIAELECDKRTLVDALKGARCHCECSTHGFGCGLQEATCRLKTQCRRCKALAAMEGK